jgi:hypothetical protein
MGQKIMSGTSRTPAVSKDRTRRRTGKTARKRKPVTVSEVKTAKGLSRTLTHGIILRGGTELDELRSGWREALAAGPRADQAELATRRYMITNLLDDLRDAEDPLERQVIAASLFEKTGELILITGHRWIGLGKHLPRRLRELDGERAELLSDPLLRGDLNDFADRVEAELDRLGGRVQAGFVRR